MTRLDMSKPNIARMYDYWLGGKDNFEADRQAAEVVRERRPNDRRAGAGQQEVPDPGRQLRGRAGCAAVPDIGSGLPTSPVRADGAAPLWLATHEAAQAVVPDALVAYVDFDPVAVAHSQALLASGSQQVVAVDGDMGDPEAIVGRPRHPGRRFPPGRARVRDPLPACCTSWTPRAPSAWCPALPRAAGPRFLPDHLRRVGQGPGGEISPAPTTPRTARGSTPTPGTRSPACSKAWTWCHRAWWTARPGGRTRCRPSRRGPACPDPR